MKIKGASAYTCYVKDPQTTADFYQKLGLDIKDQSSDRVVIYINWYRIDFVRAGSDDYEQFKNESSSSQKGAGVFFYFSVDDVDQAYHDTTAAGLKPATQPQNTAWGTYEFVLLDPDGYKLV